MHYKEFGYALGNGVLVTMLDNDEQAPVDSLRYQMYMNLPCVFMLDL